jgi:epoxyqueuosine reductase
MSVDPVRAAALVKEAAAVEGFDLVGIASAAPLDPGPLDRWLAEGWDAGLWYVRQSRDERVDVTRVLPGAQSVVAVAVSYRHPEPERPEGESGVVARYARGRDYHNVMRRPLRRLRDAVERLVPGSVGYASCDARPVMEKAWAQRAGLGWIGKNGCLVTPGLGSYVLLGCVVTTGVLAPDEAHPDRCGTCEACLPSCPTGAIPAPRFVDARRCISFHTIEHRDPIPDELKPKLAGRLFGCDLCQEACPWNRHEAPPPGRLGQALAPRPSQSFVPLDDLLRSSRAEVEARIEGTPLARAGYDGLTRTARALAGEDG